MSANIRHRWHSYRPNNPEKEVSSTEWNAAHVVDPGSVPLNALQTTGTALPNTVLHGDGTWQPESNGGGPSGKIPITQIDTGISTPSASTFLRGDSTWATPTSGGDSGPSGKMHYQYLIYLDGGNAIAVDSNGTQIASAPSGACASVFQTVVNQNPIGIIAIGQGQFNLDTSIKLQNNRSYNFYGSGSASDRSAGTTLFNSAPNARLFEVVDSGIYSWTMRFVTLRDLNLHAEFGTGLICDLPAHSNPAIKGGTVSPRFNFQDLHVTCNIGFKINTPYNMFFKHINYYNEQANCRFMWFTNTSADVYPFHCGNSNFYGIYGDIRGEGGIGILLDQTTGTGWINEMCFFGVMFLTTEQGETGGVGQAGIQLRANNKTTGGGIALLNFEDCRIENFTYGIEFLGKTSADNGATAGSGKVFKTSFSNYYGGNRVADVKAAGVEAFYDVVFKDCHFDNLCDLSGVAGTGYETPTFSLVRCLPGAGILPPASGPYHIEGDGVWVKTSHAGTYTGTQTITHGIRLGYGQPKAPTYVAVTPITSGITSLSVTNINATSFTVTCTPSGTYLVHAWLNFPNP